MCMYQSFSVYYQRRAYLVTTSVQYVIATVVGTIPKVFFFLAFDLLCTWSCPIL